MGLKFRRQEAVGVYVLDFYCASVLLGVEIDGPTHRVDGGPERDIERDNTIRAEGIEVVRVKADEITIQILVDAIAPYLERRRWE